MVHLPTQLLQPRNPRLSVFGVARLPRVPEAVVVAGAVEEAQVLVGVRRGEDAREAEGTITIFIKEDKAIQGCINLKTSNTMFKIVNQINQYFKRLGVNQIRW